jgi:2',3'-cyclic-nucleotide 2'-phosphodiesterase (5'-nucleotidase family)
VSSDVGVERLVVKADAEARTVALFEVTVPETGASPRVKLEYRELGPKAPGDPGVSQVVEEWMVRFDEDYCRENLEQPPGCLEEVLGHTQVKLRGEELEIRRYETNLGSWIAQLALEEHADRGVVAAFVNSGSLRLNQDLPPGPVTLRHVEEIFQFPSYLRVLEIRGAVLQQVIERAVEGWTGSGHWLQIAGFAFRHDPERHTARGLALLTPEGPRPVDPEEVLRVVTSAYVADPKTDQDGYRMLTREMWVDEEPARKTLKALVIEALRRAEPGGIAPQVEGRICSTDRDGPCLALDP